MWLDWVCADAYKSRMENTSSPVQVPQTQTDRTLYYRALAARDTRFDGVFFTGVKTTGVYCRPVCTVKTPRESSCEFFTSAAAAEAAGFRPCLRCRPELAPYALQQNLAYAVWQRIAAGALNNGDVEQLAEEVGLSSRQLRRVLLQHFGVTPIELAQTQRLLFAKKLLQETNLSMVDVAYAAGFGSVRRFNTLFAERYRMAPTDVRRAVQKEDKNGSVADALTLRLAYRPPFDWGDLAHYLAGRAIPGVEAVEQSNGVLSYVRSVRMHTGSGIVEGWLRISPIEGRHQLQAQLSPSLAPVLMPLVARLRNQFDLDANPEVIEQHLRQDSLLRVQLERTPGMRVPGAFDPFELAVRAVLGQQVSVAGATTLAGRLVARFGQPYQVGPTLLSKVTHHFPTAQLLATADVAEIARIGMPGTRAETIRALARFAANGGLQMMPGSTLDEAVACLKSVPGIGNWTAQYIALRALRFPDAFPAGDLGLQKAAARAMKGADAGARLTEKQLLAQAHAWSPWRGYAALLLWHSLG